MSVEIVVAHPSRMAALILSISRPNVSACACCVSQTDESCLGRRRRVTDFEHAHFSEENMTPGRPCTAYF